MNILWIDVETTGLDRQRHGIIQIAGIVDLDGEVAETFSMQMNPEAEFDPASQPIHGISAAQIERYPPRQETFERFKEILERYVQAAEPAMRFYPGGYNVRFDLGFLDQWFRSMKEPGLARYFHRDRVDPSMMMRAYQEYLGKARMPSWSLRAAATHMGLTYGSRHDALEDITLTREIHRRLLSLFSVLSG